MFLPLVCWGREGKLAFVSLHPTLQTSAAATRIKKAVEISQMSDQLCDSYNHLFTNLKEWIIKKKTDFDVSVAFFIFLAWLLIDIHCFSTGSQF